MNKISMEDFKKMNMEELRKFCREDEESFLEFLKQLFSEWYLGEFTWKMGNKSIPEEILLKKRNAAWDKFCDQIPELHAQKGKF